MWAAFPTSQWIQLKIGLFDESGCGRNAAKIGWKNASTVVTTPNRACVWLGPDTHSPSSTNMHADPANDRIQVNIINRRCHYGEGENTCFIIINIIVNSVVLHMINARFAVEFENFNYLLDYEPNIRVWWLLIIPLTIRPNKLDTEIKLVTLSKQYYFTQTRLLDQYDTALCENTISFYRSDFWVCKTIFIKLYSVNNSNIPWTRYDKP